MLTSERLQQEIINTKFKSTLFMVKLIENLSGEKVLDYDTCIDDGSDDEENDYVIETTFFTNSYTIRVFYGDVNEIISFAYVGQN
jgi:hypothetical protein